MDSFNLGLFATLWIIAFVLTRIGLMRMFTLAGKASYLAWVPVLSWWHWIKIVGRPNWYMLGMVIPGLNILFSFNITLDLLRAFGKTKFWEQLVGTVVSFVYFPFLAFDKKLIYLGQAGTKEWREKNIKPSGWAREWGDAILFAAYVAGGMRALYFDLYQIPTPSMESNLMVGDYLVVSRVNVGMRIPLTPITLPIVSPKEIAGIKAYADILELPYMRLPGWYTIKNNDVIVFNWPADGEQYPIDKKDNYVKRCVAVPGDTYEMRNGQIYINNVKLPVVGRTQKRYLALMKELVTEDFLYENNLGDFHLPAEKDAQVYIEAAKKNGITIQPYLFYTWPENFDKLKKHPAVLSIFEEIKSIDTDKPIFPDTNATAFLRHRWDVNNYGPVYLPKRGESIKLTKENWDFLKLAINQYEEQDIEYMNGQFIDKKTNQPISSYTFKMGYYWMIGDNRYNSLDSRYWGYVPENHIIGKPLFTFFSKKKVISIDPETYLPVMGHGGPVYDSKGWLKGIRYDRIFKWID
jgi:signal peptidase I